MSVTVEQIDAAIIDPLTALDFPRAKGANGKPITVKAFQDGLDRLRKGLRYLPAEDLEWVARETLLMAENFKRFPPPYLILDTAHRRRIDPVREQRIDDSVRSMMRSEAGKRALADDCAVEMLQEVLRVGHGFKVIERQHQRWRAQAREKRHAEKRRFAAEIADHERALDALEQATVAVKADPSNAGLIETVGRLRHTADGLAAAATRAQRHLTAWAELEATAQEMVRASAPVRTPDEAKGEAA